MILNQTKSLLYEFNNHLFTGFFLKEASKEISIKYNLFIVKKFLIHEYFLRRSRKK